MVSWLASSSVDRGFEPESDQIKDYKIAICFFAKHAELSDLSTVDYGFSVRDMVYNTTFNNLSVISWWSVLLVKETGENHRPVASHLQTLSHNVVSSTPRHERDSNSQLQWLYALIAEVVVNPTTIRLRRPLFKND